jgi:DNA recombination protein RmuC
MMDFTSLLIPFCLVLLLVLMLSKRFKSQQSDELLMEIKNLQEKIERLERDVRYEIHENLKSSRQELSLNLGQFQTQQMEQMSALQKGLSDSLNTQILAMSESNSQRLSEVRATLDQQLQQLQGTNAAKLDEMRKVVDEKLQTTLEARLSQSFKQVADRLEQVHQGLGLMQNLAQGVGDLQRVLTNVKSRGIFGETQLESLLEQVLTVEQYSKQVETRPRSNQRVDFAIKFPGRSTGQDSVWLPIDAKFPRDDYERLLDARDQANAQAAEIAGKALESRIKAEAKSIAENYLAPPHTTDFAILFLPVEGLYAEVLRRPGLMDTLQREYRVTLAGPTTLLAMLNSLQMGFRTLALQEQASEVWRVLGAVKTEFERYGEWVGKVREQVQKAADTLDRADTRGRQMRRALKGVESLSEVEALAILPLSQSRADLDEAHEPDDLGASKAP